MADSGVWLVFREQAQKLLQARNILSAPQVGVKGIPIDWHLLIVSETQGDRTIASV